MRVLLLRIYLAERMIPVNFGLFWEYAFVKFRLFPVFPIFVSLVIASGTIAAQEDSDKASIDGLFLIDDTQLASVYLQPGVAMSQYRRICLDDTYIAFKKEWPKGKNVPDPKTINADDMAKMKTELSSLFRDVFSRTLEESGYEMVNERAEDVLLVKPAIVNLGIVETESPSVGNVHSYTETAGEITLYLEMRDSLTNDLIGKAYDRQTDRQTGYFLWQNRLSNRAAANRIMEVWARVLKEGLDEARRAPVSY
jgi:hypothetical protein